MIKIKHARKLRDLRAPRLEGVMREISTASQSDRAVAIIGAAIVDLVLLDALTSRMARHDDKVIEQLFGDGGQLQPYGARIQLGYLLGIYAVGVFQDLRAVKDIRNAFAHSAETMDFNHPDISRLTAALNLPKKIHYRGQPDPTTSRERYVRAVELVTDLLLHDMTLRAAGRGGETGLQIGGH